MALGGGDIGDRGDVDRARRRLLQTIGIMGGTSLFSGAVGRALGR